MKNYVIVKKIVAIFLITCLFIGLMSFIKSVQNSNYEINVELFRFMVIYTYVLFMAFEGFFFLYFFSGAIDDFPRLFKKHKKDNENKDGK